VTERAPPETIEPGVGWVNMALPTPKLDDRTFQNFVDDLKRLITRYCPEWTDHNVSDPGVALIELFAWLAEQILYRVNRLPEKAYIQFLELIGVTLRPATAAEAPVTFYLTKSADSAVCIPADTQVSTTQTESNPAIIFTTLSDLAIKPVKRNNLVSMTTRPAWGGMVQHDKDPRKTILVWGEQPMPEDAFELAFDVNISHHVLDLEWECATAEGDRVNPLRPPMAWEAWTGGPIELGWEACDVRRPDEDETGGLNESGVLRLHLPKMEPVDRDGKPVYLLRTRLTKEQANPANSYAKSPQVNLKDIQVIGGTTPAQHMSIVNGEVLGRSDGKPGQRFKFDNERLLDLDREREYLEALRPDGVKDGYVAVESFAFSKGEDRHFVIDYQAGTLHLPPQLVQPEMGPDGLPLAYSFGAIPPRDSLLKFTRYRYGGGAIGNVLSGHIDVLREPLSDVHRVTNRTPASGGCDAESLEDAMIRAPRQLRSMDRAVTAADYRFFAEQVSSVGRAYAITPSADGAQPDDPRPGEVHIIVLKKLDGATDQITEAQLTPAAPMLEGVRQALEKRCVLGTRIKVKPPVYTRVSVAVVIGIPKGSPRVGLSMLQANIERALYRYIHPYIGGPDGKGWPFGRALTKAELFGVVQRQLTTPGAFVQDLHLGQPETAMLPLPRAGLMYSGKHDVRIVEV
jgi:predicted phage baseplate assembly protein